MLTKMLANLWYSRPARVHVLEQDRPQSSGAKSALSTGEKSRPASFVQGVPSALSFDKIIAGGTCPVSLSGVSFCFPSTIQLGPCLRSSP